MVPSPLGVVPHHFVVGSHLLVVVSIASWWPSRPPGHPLSFWSRSPFQDPSLLNNRVLLHHAKGGTVIARQGDQVGFGDRHLLSGQKQTQNHRGGDNQKNLVVLVGPLPPG